MEGSYLCRAKNAAGEMEDIIQVIVNENSSGRGADGKQKGISMNAKSLTCRKCL